MTHLLYHTDSYLKEFNAEVIGLDEHSHAVLLDQTAFYPGGGGQPADSGTLIFGSNLVNVLRARKGEGGIWHNLEPTSSLPKMGEKVEGNIEWTRRFQLMRTHTAMHVLCGTVFRDYGALVTGGEMEPLKGRMDFEFESMSADLVHVIEVAINKEVAKNHEVRVKILPRAEAFAIPDLIRTKINLLPPEISEIRTVEIVGLDLQADGGTHVHNTSEVGHIRVVDYKSKGKINKRIYVELD
jgi:misacylated tRNA(Ala) deacylase